MQDTCKAILPLGRQVLRLHLAYFKQFTRKKPSLLLLLLLRSSSYNTEDVTPWVKHPGHGVSGGDGWANARLQDAADDSLRRLRNGPPRPTASRHVVKAGKPFICRRLTYGYAPCARMHARKHARTHRHITHTSKNDWKNVVWKVSTLTNKKREKEGQIKKSRIQPTLPADLTSSLWHVGISRDALSSDCCFSDVRQRQGWMMDWGMRGTNINGAAGFWEDREKSSPWDAVQHIEVSWKHQKRLGNM